MDKDFIAWAEETYGKDVVYNLNTEVGAKIYDRWVSLGKPKPQGSFSDAWANMSANDDKLGEFMKQDPMEWIKNWFANNQGTVPPDSVSPTPITQPYSGQEGGWATDLAGIDPAWLAGQPANATIMSGGNVLRQGATTQVYTIGGKDYTQEQIQRLDDLGLLDPMVKAAQPPAGLTEWQKQDLERWLMDADAQRQQTYAAEMKNKLIQEGNAWQRQQAQMAARGGGLGGYESGKDYNDQIFYLESQMKEMERAKQAADFETMRKDMISAWSNSPRDWIKLYKAQNETNPYGSTEVDKAVGSPKDTGPSGPDAPGAYQAKTLYADEPPVYEWVTPTVPTVPKTPEIPDWLSKFSGVSGRVPEKGAAPVNMLTPSMQSYNKLTAGQRDMWGGLIDWSGARTQADILDQMDMMRTKNPTLGRRTTPARQRTGGR